MRQLISHSMQIKRPCTQIIIKPSFHSPSSRLPHFDSWSLPLLPRHLSLCLHIKDSSFLYTYMEPSIDPPPPATDSEPAAAPAATADLHTVHAANPTPTSAPAHNHPPYVEMITAAISALKERNGSSKRAIAKYIETQYKNLPPTHSALLTYHLKRLKTNGLLVMVKNSYKVARSTAATANAKGNGNSVTAAASVGPKRRPGRPPKNFQAATPNIIPVFVREAQLATSISNAVPVAVPGIQPNMAIGPGSVLVAVGSANGETSGAGVGKKRGRGRPPKQGGTSPGGQRRGRPKKDSTVTAVPSGQPKESVSTAVVMKGPARPRGRPPKPKDVAAGAPPSTVVSEIAAAPSAVGGIVEPTAVVLPARKGPGRPPKAVTEKFLKPPTLKPRKPRKLSGKPLGRPKKNASGMVIQAPDSQQQMAYDDLKGKFEYLQSRIKSIVGEIKPTLNSPAALNALQELEELASAGIGAPTNVQGVQPQPQQPEPVTQI